MTLAGMLAALAGMLAALAGMMSALWNLSVNPGMLGSRTTINALLMTIIGGAGALWGSLLGAGFLQLVGYWLNDAFGPRWPLFFGLVYIGKVRQVWSGLVRWIRFDQVGVGA